MDVGCTKALIKASLNAHFAVWWQKDDDEDDDDEGNVVPDQSVINRQGAVGDLPPSESESESSGDEQSAPAAAGDKVRQLSGLPTAWVYPLLLDNSTVTELQNTRLAKVYWWYFKKYLM